MNWRKTYTDIDNVNNGQEFENSDYPTKEAFNVALNNTQALKTEVDKLKMQILSPSNTVVIQKAGLYLITLRSRTSGVTNRRQTALVSVENLYLMSSENAVYYSTVGTGLLADYYENNYVIRVLSSYSYDIEYIKLIIEY